MRFRTRRPRWKSNRVRIKERADALRCYEAQAPLKSLCLGSLVLGSGLYRS